MACVHSVCLYGYWLGWQLEVDSGRTHVGRYNTMTHLPIKSCVLCPLTWLCCSTSAWVAWCNATKERVALWMKFRSQVWRGANGPLIWVSCESSSQIQHAPGDNRRSLAHLQGCKEWLNNEEDRGAGFSSMWCDIIVCLWSLLELSRNLKICIVMMHM